MASYLLYPKNRYISNKKTSKDQNVNLEDDKPNPILSVMLTFKNQN